MGCTTYVYRYEYTCFWWRNGGSGSNGYGGGDDGGGGGGGGVIGGGSREGVRQMVMGIRVRAFVPRILYIAILLHTIFMLVAQ